MMRALFCLSLLLVAGCLFDSEPLKARQCDVLADCPAGQRCEAGYCQGAALGCGVDADCDDGAFCNGAERCAPEGEPVDARGCAMGQPPPVEALPCAQVACDEVVDQIVVDESGCGCVLDQDCQTPCAIEARCQAGQCERVNEAVGAPCDDSDGVYCTVGRCDAGGLCLPTPDEALCVDPCRRDAQCRPSDPSADLAGCAFEPVAEGGACEASCGVGGAGACRSGACVGAPGPAEVGGACLDGIDNDCDGQVDEGDGGCAAPDALEISGPAEARAGLLAEGARVQLVARRGGEALTDQGDQVYCVGRAIGPSIAFGSVETLADTSADPRLTIFDPEGRAVEAAPGHVASGVPLGGPDGALGSRICDGYGISVGPFAMPSVGEVPVRTFQVAVRAGVEPGEGGLGQGARLVISYRTRNSLNGGRFVPALVLGGEGDEGGLSTAAFAIRNGGGVGTLEVRVDVIGLEAGGAEGSCGFVERIDLFEVINPTLGVRRPNWRVGGFLRPALESFAVLAQELPLILSPEGGLEHALALESAANVDVGFGASWRATESGAPRRAFVELPRAQPAVVAAASGSPLYVDMTAMVAEGSWRRGEVVHLLASTGRGFARIASGAPVEGMPAHLTSAYRFIDRAIVLLPESARPLVNLRLRLEQAPLEAPARAFVDGLSLYFHHDQATFEVSASAGQAPPGAQVIPFHVRSARPGPVEVRCFWQRGEATVESQSARVTFQ